MAAARRTAPATVVLAALVLAGTMWVGGRSVAGAPPLGGLLDPVNGVWALARRALPPARAEAAIPHLSAPVDVRVDDRGVPHIFASSIADAARAMGYVHARDRLFQLEIQTRAVAGTLSEMVGDRALPLDREAREQGLADAATRGFDRLPPDAPARVLATAYADGVNAYIDAMTPADLPFEFRLLDARPQRWEPKYTAYLFARMGLTLAYTDGELRRAAMEALVGHDATDALFPRNSPIQEPIQPNGQHAPRFDWQVIPPPKPGDGATARTALAEIERRATLASALDGVVDLGAGRRALDPAAPLGAALARPTDDAAVGSNNWVVAPKRTAAGHALLAGDPHLSLTLPSIWYEAHLVVPDSLDVYGVTIPGAPIPPIGFNRNVAWTETNTGADVADYFVETVDDPAHPRQYKLDGAWKPLRQRVEVIRGRGGHVIETDTVLETHRGPMLRSGGQWVSRRWTVTDGYDVMKPFLGAARSASVRELWAATDSFLAPAQNFATADRGGHIAIRSTGRFPIRPKDADRGDELRDGSRSSSDWQAWWTTAEYPQAYDPPQGYVASANQQPKDPRVDPRYLGWDWPSPWRAMRINEMLRADSAVTPDRMRRMQTDPLSAETPLFLPRFIAAGEAGTAQDASLATAVSVLKEWDGRYTSDNTGAVLYEAALDELTTRTWDELVDTSAAGRNRRVATPEAEVTLELMQQPDSPWWDDRSTPDVHERRDDILRASLAAAFTRVVARLGVPGPAWAWGRTRHALVRHLLGIPALSRANVLVSGGGPGAVTPSAGDGNHGASWRMVVELGDEVRAWGIYPGGQSGNPASPRYADRLGKWSAGTLDSLHFPRRAQDLAPANTSSRLSLRGAP
ncbi:MAG TPA: penicillin acylase family protein [Gemmatimonadaceae bacterium]|nr:penicillin acylase family protein [Gemmatimonadaceae bacterium]